MTFDDLFQVSVRARVGSDQVPHLTCEIVFARSGAAIQAAPKESARSTNRSIGVARSSRTLMRSKFFALRGGLPRAREVTRVLSMATIGFIGAGNIGGQVARLAIQSGHDVVISNSRGPDTLAALVKELGPKARAGTVQDAAQSGDEIVVVSIPLGRFRTVPIEPLAGKIVIDTNNYYPQRDGHIAELEQETATSTELLQQHLPSSKVVKAFNHIYAAELTTHGQKKGTPNRRALVIAGDDAKAKATVTDLLDKFGFDTVDAGSAKDSWRIQPGTPAYGPRRNAEQLRADLESAKRPAPR